MPDHDKSPVGSTVRAKAISMSFSGDGEVFSSGFLISEDFFQNLNVGRETFFDAAAWTLAGEDTSKLVKQQVSGWFRVLRSG